MNKEIVLFASIAFLLLVAVETGAASVIIENPLKYESFEKLTESITNTIFVISMAVVVLMILIGAFFILTSGGDSDRFQRGKNIVLYALIGLAIILFARGLLSALKYLLGVDETASLLLI